MNLINGCFSKLQEYSRNFNIGHINAQSIPKHIDEITNLVVASGLECLCISESFLKSHLPNYMFEIPGYKLVRADGMTRRTHGAVRRGGGVALFLNVDIPHKILFKSGADDSIEYFFVELTLKFIKIVVAVVYKAPNVCYRQLSFLSNILDELAKRYDDIFIFGDFNVNFLNDNLDKKFLEDIFSPFEISLINEKATHWPPNHPPSLIDLFFTNCR
jgi:hypothetical protein